MTTSATYGTACAVRRMGRIVLVAVALCLGTALFAASPAAAHADLVSSTPGDGETLQNAPAHLVFRLSESVELSATRVTITDASGHAVPITSITLHKQAHASTEEPTSLVVGLPPLTEGQYRVSWTTLSSDDLHVTKGVVVFGVGQAVTRQGLAPESRPSTAEATLRWMGLLGLGVTLGAGVLLLLLVRPSGLPQTQHIAVARRLLSLAAAAALVAVGAGVGLPVVQAGQGAGAVGPTLRRLLFHESYAAWFWSHEAALLVLAVIALLARRRLASASPVAAQVAGSTAAGLVAVVSAVLMGHAGVRPSSHVGLVALESIHVLSAMLWAGSVVAAVLVLTLSFRSDHEIGALRRTVLRRFGFVAAPSLAVAGLSGVLLAGARIVTPDALVHSTYGRVLLLKTCVVVIAAGFGLVNLLLLRPAILPRRLRALPAVGRARSSGRIVALEAATIVLLIGVTAFLAASPPAIGQRWTPRVAATGLLSGQASDLVEALHVQPNRPGVNFVGLELFDTRRPSPGRVESLVVSLRSPDGQRFERVAAATGDSTWVIAGQRLTPGRWTAQVRADRAGLPTARASYAWDVPDPSLRRVTGWSARRLSTWTRPAATSLALLLLLLAAALVGLRRGRAAAAALPRSEPPAQDLEARERTQSTVVS